MSLAHRPIVTRLVVLVLLAGCTAPTPPPTPVATAPPSVQPVPLLRQAELQALYAAPHREDGVVLRGSHTGRHWTKWSKPDGTLRILAGGGVFTDHGRYDIAGDQLCSTWETIDAGRRICMRVGREGPDSYITYDLEGFEGSRFRVSQPSSEAAE